MQNIIFKSRLALVVCLTALLCACNPTAGALPPGPTPFPTLPRLPSVTPAPPSPTPEPTLPPLDVTPTPIRLEAVVTVGANVRAGPGLTFATVGSIAAGERLSLQAQSDDWYLVTLPNGVEGWISSVVLELPADATILVPTLTP